MGKMRNYYPDGMRMWDTWYLHLDGVTHLFHLQVRRAGGNRPDEDEGSIGHAVSEDLLDWTEMPVALHRGDPGDYDDGTLFTGCAVEEDGVIYLYYCSNHNENGRGRQAMCLAISEDGGQTFRKYPGNPIIEPDPQWYYSISEPPPPFKHHAHPAIDCRDQAVVKNPSGKGWLGYVVMRRKETDAFRSSCIALCRSNDLIHWEIGPPCFVPNRFNCFEVPDVFYLDGRWYMIALTGDGYGQSLCWSDPGITYATIVGVADHPEGPFSEIKDNLLLAANNNQGFSARTVEVRGERLMLYTRSENGLGRLSWPVKIISQPDGGLLPVYWTGCDRAFGMPKNVQPVNIQAGSEWNSHTIEDFPTAERTFMISAKIVLNDAKSAGLAFRHTGSGIDASAYLTMFDTEKSEVVLINLPGFIPIQHRRWEVKPYGIYNLRIIVVGEMIEVYVDDVLALQCYDDSLANGGVSLFARGGIAGFSDLVYRGEAL